MCYSVAVIGQPHKNEPSPHPSSTSGATPSGDYDSLLVTCVKPGSQYDTGAVSVVHECCVPHEKKLVKLHPCC